MNKLREIRRSLYLTQKEFATSLDVSQQGYSQYENNKRDIPTNVLKKISNKYNISIDYILGLENKRYKKTLVNNTNDNNLSIIRNKFNYTQEYMANYLNVTRSCYTKYELGILDIPTDILINLSKLYNVSIDYLLKISDK